MLLACNQTKELVKYSSNYQDVVAVKGKPSRIDAAIAPYKKELDEQMNEAIATSAKELSAYRPESELSNFVSDLLREVAQKYAQKHLNNETIAVSLANNGGLRSSLPKGTITVRNIFELMPFENELVLLQLSGEQLKQMLDAISRRGGEGVSGCRLTIKDDKATAITVLGEAIDNNNSYWVATSDYLASGGDTFHMLAKPQKRVNTGLKIRDVIISDLKEKNSKGIVIDAKLDGRIKDAK
jgi:2',3'-cyclic-nucleotide 2'-phosphodiesterase (5'-nucleotidase family)